MEDDDHYYDYKGKHKETKYFACSMISKTSCKARLICQDRDREHLDGNHSCVTHDHMCKK
ncbi:FLYWCH zinc finger domain-containing protein [Phytophthora infestans]|uniref:FLYWCH zinc finger domain-containing protein n=1 Tax=Phytophthora infestans TaxID=4787 RepID=A0A8S9U379_PHYIN|nr:FLYWCH zinc finger domain-containing protein [Phytophthora infestans]